MALGTPSWLNLDFTQGILRRAEGDNSIEVIDIYSKPATNKGDNYASDMIRVFVEYSRQQAGRKVTGKTTIILKLAATAEGKRKELTIKARIFETEINMMTNTLEKMKDLIGSGKRFSPRVYHAKAEHPAFVVMEDLAFLGFRMANRQRGLDRQHCTLAIQNLARFHAASVALCEKEPYHKELYQRGMFNNEEAEDILAFFSFGTKALAYEVETWPELGKRYADKIRKIAEDVHEKSKESVKLDDEFNVITHGDFWVNNMLFRYDDKGQPIDHIFVDFQTPMYTSPAIDLHYFLSTSPAPEVYDTSKGALLEEYLATLTSTMKQLGCKTPAPSMDQLKRYLKQRAVYGLLAAFAVLPLVLIDKSEVMEFDELMGMNGAYTNPAYKGALYRKIMVKRIPEYEELGLLDC